MTWDITTPAGSELISLGDDNIRELKADIQTALRGNAADGTEAKFPGSDTANPVFRYRGLKGNTGSRPSAGQYGLYINTTLNTIQRDNGSAWEDVATLIPSGTKMVFYQASAPTGWTAVSVNDKFLRVVTAGGTGGTNGGTVAASTSLAHTHTLAHTHSVPNHQHSFETVTRTIHDSHIKNEYISTQGAGNPLQTITNGGGPGTQNVVTTRTQTDGGTTSGAASSETTSSSLGAFAYADIIIATKD